MLSRGGSTSENLKPIKDCQVSLLGQRSGERVPAARGQRCQPVQFLSNLGGTHGWLVQEHGPCGSSHTVCNGTGTGGGGLTDSS